MIFINGSARLLEISMTTFTIDRPVFGTGQKKKPTGPIRRIGRAVVAVTIVATGAVGYVESDRLYNKALDRWNTLLIEHGIVRPPVAIDVADPVFFDSVVSWAVDRGRGMTNVNRELVSKYVTIAFAEAANHRVDPLLVMAVMAVESRFDFMAVSSANARGLMQIIPFWHKDKIAVAQVFDPVANIRAGTKILREYTDAHNGNINRALLNYNGSLGLPGSNYDVKVLSARADLRRSIEREFVRNFRRKYENAV